MMASHSGSYSSTARLNSGDADAEPCSCSGRSEFGLGNVTSCKKSLLGKHLSRARKRVTQGVGGGGGGSGDEEGGDDEGGDGENAGGGVGGGGGGGGWGGGVGWWGMMAANLQCR
mmetsp:Transcript_47193/g.93499  ORF Transcript_47193/g.93499 Transcript_47193/m.93499 type:complete len:115 (+) Transcript_47193:828-1172(+)